MKTNQQVEREYREDPTNPAKRAAFQARLDAYRPDPNVVRGHEPERFGDDR